jgi:hypothetical protein
MTKEIKSSTESLIPPQPIPAGAEAFSERMHGLMDGRPKDDAAVSKALEGMDDIVELIAAGLYNLASMLVGEGEDAMGLVETAIATTEVSVCHDPVEGRKGSRRALCTAALGVIERRNPGSLAAPIALLPVATCIEDDDLDAAGVSREELENMIAGPDKDRVRNWLAGLPVRTRTIFVLRAVAGFSAADTVTLLATHGGPDAAKWTSEVVREFFRQGLCSLASQLIQATAVR